MHAAPGWYPDPEAPHQQRWWDGTAWTESRLDRASQPPPATMPPVAPAPAPRAHVALERQAEALMAAARRPQHRSFFFGDDPRELVRFLVIVGVFVAVAAGFGLSRLNSTWGSVGLGSAAAPAAAGAAADADCIARWNATSGPVGAQRRLLGSNRDNLLVHVSRVTLDLPGAMVAGGSCGVVVADRQGNTLHAFSDGTGGAAGQFIDIGSHRAAQYLGRVRGASDVNAALAADGTLQAITPAAG